jgi:hypothetical protein
MTISPPYCGTPSLSHQFPLAVAVLVVDVGGIAVVDVVVVLVVVDAGTVEVVVVVVVVALVVQDASIMAEMSRMLSVIIINLFFTSYLLVFVHSSTNVLFCQVDKKKKSSFI